jgi:plastocyanin
MQASVSMVNLSFSPASVEVAVGGTVTWHNDDNETHNASGEGVTIANTNPGQSRSQVMPNAGSFPYNCTLHSGMSGTVIVRQ